jgi:hypothetical protein
MGVRDGMSISCNHFVKTTRDLLNRRRFGAMLGRIALLPVPTG